MTAKIPITIGSRWQVPGDARVFVVTKKKPFGGVTIKQEDRHYYGEATQKELRATFRPVAA